MLVRLWRKFINCWLQCKLVQPLWKTVWPFFKGLDIEIPFDLAISLLGIYPKDYKLFYYKDTCPCIPSNPITGYIPKGL